MRFSATVYGRRSQKSNIGMVGWLVGWLASQLVWMPGSCARGGQFSRFEHTLLLYFLF